MNMRRQTLKLVLAPILLSSESFVSNVKAQGLRYENVVREIRRPLAIPIDSASLLEELTRCATLAANSHNTQPWTISQVADGIFVKPDFSRRTPAVDPDDHHLWVSIGCAVENLVIAAEALGKHSEVDFDDNFVKIRLSEMPSVSSPLVEAIFKRQCTRALYDCRALETGAMRELEQAARRPGVSVQFLDERESIEGVLGFVTRGNSAQMHDAAFVKELRGWIRFSEASALKSGDGLFGRSSGNPVLPDWVGKSVFRVAFREKSENDKYAKQLRSSAGLAVFVADRPDPAHWIEVGRSYERFALTATVREVRNAFVNQPCEVPEIRQQFSSWLGIGPKRPDLIVRFGYGPVLPYSLRRPVSQVIV
jgi:hypothetical protein